MAYAWAAGMQVTNRNVMERASINPQTGRVYSENRFDLEFGVLWEQNGSILKFPGNNLTGLEMDAGFVHLDPEFGHDLLYSRVTLRQPDGQVTQQTGRVYAVWTAKGDFVLPEPVLLAWVALDDGSATLIVPIGSLVKVPG